jgi:hypothetical protein
LPGTGGTSRSVYVSLPDNCCMVLHAPWSTSYPHSLRSKLHAFRQWGDRQSDPIEALKLSPGSRLHL